MDINFLGDSHWKKRIVIEGLVEEWEKNKLTPKKVLAVIRRYITSQNTVPRKEVALVKTSYGFSLCCYRYLLSFIDNKGRRT